VAKRVEVERPISAAVLAGGQSRRMGTDKALLPLRPGDPPLLRLVLDRVEAVADDVLIVASERPAYGRFGVPIVADRFGDGGTLGGIATALATARHEHCLVVGCDLPFLNPLLLAWMVEQPRDYDVLIPRLPGESRQGHGFVLQTLHAVYGRACLPAIERRLSAGRRQVIGFFEDVRVRTIEPERVRRFDPEFRSFFNANTPEAAEEARRLLGTADGGAGVTAGR
jgi:molybdopterin-guanine dinucleotide biosynthesis protein A